MDIFRNRFKHLYRPWKSQPKEKAIYPKIYENFKTFWEIQLASPRYKLDWIWTWHICGNWFISNINLWQNDYINMKYYILFAIGALAQSDCLTRKSPNSGLRLQQKYLIQMSARTSLSFNKPPKKHHYYSHCNQHQSWKNKACLHKTYEK